MPIKYLDPLSEEQIDQLFLVAPKPLVFLGGDGDGWRSMMSWRSARGLGSNGTDGSDLVEFTKEALARKSHTIGFVSYDYGERILGVDRAEDRITEIPELFVRSFDEYIIFTERNTEVHYSDDFFVQEYMGLLKMLQDQEIPNSKVALQAVDTEARYMEWFNTIKQYIGEGDVYQLNLAHELQAETTIASRCVYVTLRQKNLASYQAYIEGDNFEIMSFSPECFIRTAGGMIETWPIKGTMPRSKNFEEDQQNAQRLLESTKENAELNMITDLLRNDLGKVCEIGSVKVVEERTLTAHTSVWHAHSRISGTLLPRYSPLEALLSMSPGGSITGCPKKRAMEIIAELEPKRRGIYTGSIFSIDPRGDIDSSIVIRTIVREKDRLSLRVGGGIVDDSNAEAEYLETFAKAAALTDVLR